MQISKSISLDNKLWEKIDTERGKIPRSVFISILLEEELSLELLKGGKKT